ncbi:zinc uptake transcriptional repressor Zur [Algicola sagamiensis]|uniref:zinc uptake transcriptional repressor Zur n=1 Tax=Algicola sagamiensis TaxID=163869 RepID=UPI00036BC1A7|nr:zinc uptake transcriptional repressor Zur [Algicola sagamiensis]
MSVNQLVSKAKALCDENGVRFTPIREKVFRLLATSKGSVGAYDLLEQLKLSEPAAKPATVYRALDFLSEQGFIHKIESTNTFWLCHHFGSEHHAQLLICDQCGQITELHSDLLHDEISERARSQGFQVKKQTVEVHGLCQECLASA